MMGLELSSCCITHYHVLQTNRSDNEYVKYTTTVFCFYYYFEFQFKWSIVSTQLNSSLLKHGSRVAKRDTANKTMKANELKTITRTRKITTVQ